MQVSVAPHSFDVAMGGVSPPLLGALELGLVLMEVMRGTAVSFSPILTVINSCNILRLYLNTIYLLQFVQFPVKVEHFDAAMVRASSPLAAVMGL